MNIDFAAILVLLTAGSGLIWLFDSLFLAKKRISAAAGEAAAASPGDAPGTAPPLPLMVDYAKSFFPVFLFVLILRSFIAEPFRIPSASMMPTLLIGDFILVNKYDYGVRLPVINTKIIPNNSPRRGDIVVFRYPENPSIPYIKRVVGLPGDHIAYYDKTLYINGEPMSQSLVGPYSASGSGEMMEGASLRIENLESLEHEILISPGRPSLDVELIVPENRYFVLGDNRDNSRDSRYWGFVPDEHLIGRAFFIWMNWDGRNGGIEWRRMGTLLK